MSDDKTFKAIQFMQDIGLDLWLTELPKETSKAPKSNIISFVSKNSAIMDDPRTAAYVHIRNMVLTYGKDVVLEAIQAVIEDQVG